MTRKLALNPKVSYLLGIYSANRKTMQPIGLQTKNSELLERFIKTAMDELGVEPNKILIEEGSASFYNSKIKKLFDRALERRTKTFKYLNAYSGSYIAGLFDCAGGFDRKGMFIRNLDAHDALLLENLEIHIKQQGAKSYVMNENSLVKLIKPYSTTLVELHK